MKLNFKTLLKFLIPILGLAAFSGYYRYRYVLNPDGLRNSKGELYGDKYGTFIDYPKFVNKCLSFEQDNSAISYGEIYDPEISGVEDLNISFKRQRVTLRGYGSLINSCRHDVVIERISMTSQIGDSGKLQGILESSYYPNEGFISEEDKDIDPINNIYYPDGNILKANSSLKIELASTDWYREKPLVSFNDPIPKKNTPIKFKLNKDSENLNWWKFSMKLNKDNFDGKKLAEDGLAIFRIYFKNPHGNRSIALYPNRCLVFINNEILKDGCTLKKWQLLSNNKPILNSKDFGKYSIK